LILQSDIIHQNTNIATLGAVSCPLSSTAKRIEDRDIQQEVERLRPSYEQAFADAEPAQREAQLLDWSKENVIERVLLRQDAVKSIQDVSPDHIELALTRLREQCGKTEDVYKEFNARDDDELKRMIELQIKVQRRIDEIYETAPEPTDSEVRDYYEQHKEQFQSGEQIHVAHLVTVRQTGRRTTQPPVR